MVNQDTHQIISSINSRDVGEVSNWLRQFPNVKSITRDGSLIYKSAIEMCNSEIIQISDRFHLIKNLTDTMLIIIKDLVPRNIIIEEISKKNDIKSLKTKFELTKKDIESGMSFSAACINNSMNFNTMKKLMEYNELEINEYFKDKELQKRLEKIEKKNENVRKAKELKKQGYMITQIADNLGLDQRTISKYIKDDFKFTVENTSRDVFNICKPYHDLIVSMVEKAYKGTVIYQELLKHGYSGKYGMVKRYISKIKKENEFIFKKTTKRKHLVKLIFKDLKGVEEIDRTTLLKIYSLEPKVKTYIELAKEFKGILLHTKSIKALNNWIKKAEKLGNDELNSFIKGIKQDYEAVKNSLKYKQSNGVVEASVNKIKLNKRIMYGRCSFELLQAKTHRLQILVHFN